MRIHALPLVAAGTFTVLFAAFFLPPPLTIDDPAPVPDREEYIFHVYVDPLRGDDALATQYNPNGFTWGSYLHPGQATANFLLPPCNPLPPFLQTQYNVGAWGFGETLHGGPDQAPNSAGLGVRFNCEVGPGLSNLQTFLTVSNDGTTRQSLRIPTPEEFGKPMREAMKALEKR